jgi:hypothetical protein
MRSLQRGMWSTIPSRRRSILSRRNHEIRVADPLLLGCKRDVDLRDRILRYVKEGNECRAKRHRLTGEMENRRPARPNVRVSDTPRGRDRDRIRTAGSGEKARERRPIVVMYWL